MNSGSEPFYDTIAPLWVVSEDLLPALALTFLAAVCGTKCGRSVVFTLPLGWLAGMASAATLGFPACPFWLPWGLTTTLAVLVAADRPWRAGLVTILAVLAGAAHALGNSQEIATNTGKSLALAGIICAVVIVSDCRAAGHRNIQ